MFDPEVEAGFDVFTDLLFNALIGFAFLFFIAFAMINPIAETGKIDTDVEVLVSISWPDDHPDDIDMYVQSPSGNVVWYHQPETGLMHLDRDDRGPYKDTLIINGEEVGSPLNQESVSVRGLLDGEYTVNVVHYSATGQEPVPVTAKIEKMNPSVRVIYYGNIELTGEGDEKTVVRFTVDGDDITDINTHHKSLVALTRGASITPVPR